MSNPIPVVRRFSDYCRIAFAGFAMGVANVIPGVSGGTMAFILGIFEELVGAIRTLASAETLRMICRLEIKKMYRELPWRFLLAVGIGVLVAFAGVSKLFVWLLNSYPAFTFAFFFGLIVASIVAIFRKVQKWSIANVISLLIGAAAAYVMITLVPVSTPNTWYVSFLCGVVCICAMILPGVSGSFLLLVLGQYQYIWGAIGDFSTGRFSGGNFNTIFWFGLGAVLGLGAFSHLLNYLFKKQPDLTVAALIGFMVGSVPRLWPWQQVVEVSVKTRDALMRLTLPEAADQLAALEAAGAKVTPLVVKNTAPPAFDGSFFLVLVLALFGLALVLITEKLAAPADAAVEVSEQE